MRYCLQRCSMALSRLIGKSDVGSPMQRGGAIQDRVYGPIKMRVVGMKMEMCALDLAVVSQGVEKLGKEIGQELALVTIKIRFEVLRE